MFLVNVEGAVYKDENWLIIERSMKEEHAGGLLSLVGGTVENEGVWTNLLESTLRRELLEEVGVEVKEKMVYVRNTSFPLDDGTPVLDVVFLCEFKEGEPFAKSANEVENVYWMKTHEIVNHPNAPIWLIESIKAAAEILQKERNLKVY